MVNKKHEEKDTEIEDASNGAFITEVKPDDFTSIVQIDDSELPQSIKDKFKG
ncbi:MAG: hypothetical protein V1897_20205 [Pseudomonadota bacterium]